MPDHGNSLQGWIRFAGLVLVVAVLYWAQAVLVPVCLAILLTFVLTPPVVWLQRRIGRIAAVLIVVISVFSFLALAGSVCTARWSVSVTHCPPTARTSAQKCRTFR